MEAGKEAYRKLEFSGQIGMVGMQFLAQVDQQPPHRETKLILQLREPLRIEKAHDGTTRREVPGGL